MNVNPSTGSCEGLSSTQLAGAWKTSTTVDPKLKIATCLFDTQDDQCTNEISVKHKNTTQCQCGEAYQSWLGDHILPEIISAKSLRCSPTVEILSGHHNWYLGEPAEDTQSYDGRHECKEYGHVRSCN